jgi:polyribonucleotide nucleotidyltransferase
MERQEAVRALTTTVKEAIEVDPSKFGLTENDSAGKEAYKAVDELMYEIMRKDI